MMMMMIKMTMMIEQQYHNHNAYNNRACVCVCVCKLKVGQVERRAWFGGHSARTAKKKEKESGERPGSMGSGVRQRTGGAQQVNVS